MGSEIINLPRQMMPFSQKNKAWRKKHMDWADGKSFFNYSLVRKSVVHKKINYDLLNGILHMDDLKKIINPDSISASYIPDSLQHFAIMNNKLNVLRGEESKRIFDYRVIVTNPDSISAIEEDKQKEVLNDLLNLIKRKVTNQDEFDAESQKINKYYTYTWKDFREIRANYLLNHYVKEYNIPLLFNTGFVDALAVGEEIYQCDIVGGEPVINRLNPCKVRIFKSGYSNRIEDADIIIYEDYWSPGKVIDTYYDVLTEKDIKYIEDIPDNLGHTSSDSMDNIDDRYGFIDGAMVGEEFTRDGYYFNPVNLYNDYSTGSLLPYDIAGNIRVLRLYWKSKRKIKKVKSYDPQTGEGDFAFYPETYVLNTDAGEEEEIFYINEAWEGTKIGTDIYVNMRPRLIQYNRLSNPSRCHFGIIGSIYNLNDSRPTSMVDIMKPYNYLYDVVYDRLMKVLARNWGKLVQVDLAKIPKGWDMEKWLYYARISGMAVIDSFKEGNIGASTGKLVGAMNTASSGVIDAEDGNIIQQYINLLDFIKLEISEISGISKQREGQISNRETVGGVERATLQSSYITEWLFTIHDDVKKRVMECFLETAKIAMRGKSKKFQYILPDSIAKIMDIDGDEFAESDYGVVITNDSNIQQLSQKLDTLAQAALQNQMVSFSTIMKIFTSCSMAEKQRMIEESENEVIQRQQQAQQQQQQQVEQQLAAQQQLKQDELDQKEQENIRDNETKVLVAQINAHKTIVQDTEEDLYPIEDTTSDDVLERIREFDEKMNLERSKLELDKQKLASKTEIDKMKLNNKKSKE